MFQFRRFPTHGYLIHHALPEVCSGGFPHSEILGSTPMCGSPRLIAACHVLLRLLMPRHSPCGLIRLTSRRSKRRSFRFRPHLSVRPKTSYRFVASPLQIRPASLGSNLGCRFYLLTSIVENPFLVSLQSFKNYAGSISFLLAEIVFQLP